MSERDSNCEKVSGSPDPVIQSARQIAKLYTEVEGVAASDPCFAPGAEKAKQGLLEMHTALVTPRLMPRLELEIDIPMPPGAAVPARASQSQATQIPPVDPVQATAAQPS